MKRVAFVIASLDTGGAQRVMSLLAAHLAREHHACVDIISLSAARDGVFFPLPDSVTVHHVFVQNVSVGPFSGIWNNLRRIMALRQSLKRLRPDVVVSFMTETNCLSLLAVCGLRVSVLVSERSDPWQHPHARLWRALRRVIYPQASQLICQTQHAVQFFPYLKRKDVIYNPVSVSAVTGPSAYEGTYILGVGRLSEEKGFDVLIKAFALVHERMPAVKLVIAGDGPLRPSLEALAQDLSVAPAVIFAGVQKDLSGYYAQALTFVLPSRFEGMPNSLLEAMAYGCPIVASPSFAAVGEIIHHGENGLIATALTPEDLAKPMMSLYENEALRQKLGSQARQDSQKFQADNVMQLWRGHIMRLCGS